MNTGTMEHREDDLEGELNKGALWAVTYGDLMSYLMIFFLVLFSLYVGKSKGSRSIEANSSLVDIQKIFGGKVDPELLERIQQHKTEEDLAYKLKESKEVQSLSEFVRIESGEYYVRLVLPESISFDSGKAELKSAAVDVVRVLAAYVKDLPNDVIVEGHTDSVPIRKREYPSNFILSSVRAERVMDVLIQAGVARERVSGHGYGENRPVADNETPDGRARNRRVEIVLVRRP